jgi:hypothetical protein
VGSSLVVVAGLRFLVAALPSMSPIAAGVGVYGDGSGFSLSSFCLRRLLIGVIGGGMLSLWVESSCALAAPAASSRPGFVRFLETRGASFAFEMWFCSVMIGSATAVVCMRVERRSAILRTVVENSFTLEQEQPAQQFARVVILVATVLQVST